jgi:hypothetical protein
MEFYGPCDGWTFKLASKQFPSDVLIANEYYTVSLEVTDADGNGPTNSEIGSLIGPAANADLVLRQIVFNRDKGRHERYGPILELNAKQQFLVDDNLWFEICAKVKSEKDERGPFADVKKYIIAVEELGARHHRMLTNGKVNFAFSMDLKEGVDPFDRCEKAYHRGTLQIELSVRMAFGRCYRGGATVLTLGTFTFDPNKRRRRDDVDYISYVDSLRKQFFDADGGHALYGVMPRPSASMKEITHVPEPVLFVPARAEKITPVRDLQHIGRLEVYSQASAYGPGGAVMATHTGLIFPHVLATVDGKDRSFVRVDTDVCIQVIIKLGGSGNLTACDKSVISLLPSSTSVAAPDELTFCISMLDADGHDQSKYLTPRSAICVAMNKSVANFYFKLTQSSARNLGGKELIFRVSADHAALSEKLTARSVPFMLFDKTYANNGHILGDYECYTKGGTRAKNVGTVKCPSHDIHLRRTSETADACDDGSAHSVSMAQHQAIQRDYARLKRDFDDLKSGRDKFLEAMLSERGVIDDLRREFGEGADDTAQKVMKVCSLVSFIHETVVQRAAADAQMGHDGESIKLVADINFSSNGHHDFNYMIASYKLNLSICLDTVTEENLLYKLKLIGYPFDRVHYVVKTISVDDEAELPSPKVGAGFLQMGNESPPVASNRIVGTGKDLLEYAKIAPKASSKGKQVRLRISIAPDEEDAVSDDSQHRRSALLEEMKKLDIKPFFSDPFDIKSKRPTKQSESVEARAPSKDGI